MPPRRPAFDPVPEWLLATRERREWTQEQFLDALRAATGWAPHRPNYSKYETGKARPKADTLRKFVDFWAAQGEPGPNYTPPTIETPTDPLASALLALAGELQALRKERLETAAEVDALRGVVSLLAQRSGVELPELDALLA